MDDLLALVTNPPRVSPGLQLRDRVPCCHFSQFSRRGVSPRHEFVRVPHRTYHPVAAPASVETLRVKRQNVRIASDGTIARGAKVAMARRLAVRLYWMWRKGWDYQQALQFARGVARSCLMV